MPVSPLTGSPLSGGPGQGGGGPKGLCLGKQNSVVFLLSLPQRRTQNLRQLPAGRPGFELLCGGNLHPETSLLVIVYHPAGEIHAPQKPVQFFLPGQVGGQPCGELRGRAAHELVQPGILTAQGGPGLPSPPEGLPPAEKGGQLAVYLPQQLREMDTAGAKLPGKVRGPMPGPVPEWGRWHR